MISERMLRALEKKHNVTIVFKPYELKILLCADLEDDDYADAYGFKYDVTGDYGCQFTCSSQEVGSFNVYEALARRRSERERLRKVYNIIYPIWIKHLRHGHRLYGKHSIAHTVPYQKDAAKFLKDMGFYKVCTYQGNEGVVTRWNGSSFRRRKKKTMKKSK
jgi:hypothetical protein